MAKFSKSKIASSPSREALPDSETVIPFGKYAGEDISVLLSDENYINWILRQRGMLSDLQGKFPLFGQTLTGGLLTLGYNVKWSPKVQEEKQKTRRIQSPRSESRVCVRGEEPPPGTVIVEAQALRDEIKATYDEFKRLNVDPTTVSPADREKYRYIMDTVRRQRVPLEC
jgi:hypothetical protein